MKHYFRVSNIPQNQNSLRGKTGFFGSWLSGLSVTGWLILINVIAFFLVEIALLLMGSASEGAKNFFALTALQPRAIFENLYFWQFATSMFMHANFFHLFVNMLSLFFIGKFLEMLLGKKRFFWLYIIGGVFAGLFFAAFAYFLGGASETLGRLFGTPETLAVGASGALFAIAGVLAFLTPRNRVYLIAGPLIALIVQAVLGLFIKSTSMLNLLNFIVTIYIFISIFSLVSFSPRLQKFAVPIAMPFWLLPIAAIAPLFIIGFFVELPIGNMAHLGGFIAGAFYGIYLRIKYRRKTQIISEYFSR